jgi:hypothetical protein
MPPESNNGPLLGTGARKSFQQTGSWNMLDITKIPYESTIGILARYMSGRVNPYTGAVVEEMSRQFRLSTKGRQNTEVAIKSLKIVGSVGDVLEFGFGIEDVIRSILKTEAGTVGLVLCAALKECYHDSVAIDVLLEMARSCKVSGEFMPPSAAWEEWLNACAGVLAVTDFPTRAEHLMRLPNTKQRLGVYQRYEGLPKSLRSCASPKSLADCLSAMGCITRDELDSVTFIGGADTGWLATVAEWFFDLRVTMTMSDGKIFYTNHVNLDEVQVKIIFQDDTVDASASLQCIEKSYILKDISRILDGDRPPNAGIVSGRVKWKEALTCAFQTEFDSLMEIPHTFSELLGCASRIFKGLAEAHNIFPDYLKRACLGYCDSSFGRGLVNNIIYWFPELKKLKKQMHKSAGMSFKDAQKSYELCISKIRAKCGCRTCMSKATGFTFEDEAIESTPGPARSLNTSQDDILTDADSNRSLKSNIEPDWDSDQDCQVIIAETIIYLSRILSTVHIETDNLLPMRSGFGMAYARQLRQRRSAYSGRSAIEAVGPIAFCLDFDNNFSIAMPKGNEEAVEARLYSVLELFSGQEVSSSSLAVSAASSNGIVAFLGVLREPSVRQDAVARIHVMPGRIYHEKKRYWSLADRVLTREPISTFTEAAKIEEDPNWEETQIGVRENSQALECLLAFGKQQDFNDPSSRPPVVVGPSLLAVTLASRRGLVSCKWSRGTYRGQFPSGPSCITSRNHSLLTPKEAEDAWKMSPYHVTVQDKIITFIRPKNDTAAIATVAALTNVELTCSLYIVSSECVQCCVEAAIDVDRPERSQFCFLYLSR